MTRAAFLRRLFLLLPLLALLAGVISLFHAVPAEAGHTLPTPTNLQAQAGSGQVTLTWDRGSGSTFSVFQVAYGEHPSGTLSFQTVTTGTTTVTITGLTNGTTYRFRVRTGVPSGHNGSAWTDYVTATPTATVPVTLSTNSVVVAKSATTTYTVVLDSQPTASVTVTATSGTPAKATVSPASRTFTTTDWSVPQMFTVTGVDVGSSAITHAATSTDSNYSIAAVGTVTVTVVTETPAVPPNIQVAQGDASLTVTWDAPSYTVSAADVRLRVKDTNPNQAGNQAGPWLPDEFGTGLSVEQVSNRRVTVPSLMNGVTYEVNMYFRRAVSGGGGEIGWVTAGDGTPAAAASSDADLSGLTASTSGSASGTFSALTLSPSTFAAATTEYTASVANTVTHVKITPTTNDSNATVEVGKGASLSSVTSGSASAAIALSVGANAITVKVTAQDGTTKTYTVTVTREEAQVQNHPAPTGLRVTSGDGRLDVSWSPPPSSVGTVGAYEVQYTSASSATVSNADAASGSQTDPATGWVIALESFAASTTPSHMITGLTSGTTYRVRVSYYLSDFTGSDWAYATATPAGPDVSHWNPTVFVQELGGDRYGCRSGVTVSAMPGRSGGAECSELANFDGNAFSVSHVRFGTRGYRVLDLYIEPHRRTSWGETAYRVVLRVDDDSGTAELGRGMTLVLTTPGVTEKRLPFNAAERDGNTFRWPLFFEDGGLGWDQGWVRGVKVRIHQFTAGLDYVRVHYDEIRGGQPVNGFGAWRPAQVSAYFREGLVAYIPGQFPSSDPEQGMVTTTHAKLWVGASHPNSTLEWAIGDVDGATGAFTALAADELTPAIELNPASKWTYVYIRVTNGTQVATHTIAIDPPPRTYALTPKARATEGEEATLTLSLGSPAGAGGVSFTVSADYPADYPVGGATAADVGQFAATLTVPEGQRSARIIIPTVDDEAIEEDEERFTVRVAHVGEPAWAVDPEGTATAVVTIEDNDEPPEGPEPWDIKVVPGDGTLTVTWNVGSRAGVEDSDIWHVLRWSQEFGVWNNPRDRRAVGKNDGLSVDPGLTSYTITGLKNGVATGVFIRSMVGHRNNMSEREANSSKWVRVKGEHTTPVAPPNDAPTLSAAIADATIASESGTRQVSLSGVFSDADGDDLTITASSSIESVATVAVSNDTLTVTAKSSGSATITVTADDGAGGTVSDTFKVTVKAGPKVTAPIADINELEAGTSRSISLSGVFTDADSDRLTISAGSSDTSKAAVSVAADSSALTLSGVAAGTARITVTAQDADGNRVRDRFAVTVTAPPNNAPTVASAIADATIASESGRRQVSLSGVFSDADGDDLMIRASSSAESVATVAVSNDTLTVTAKSRGTATITITASDDEDEVSDSFTVTVKSGPRVASPIADIGELEAGAKREISLSSVFSDADGDALQVSVTTSDRAIVNISTALDGTTLSATAVTVIGVAEGTATITVTAQDSDGNSVSDAFTVTVPAAEAAQQQVEAVPGQVVNLSVRQVQPTRIRVEWDAPEDGGAVNSYRVVLSRDGEELSTRRPGAKKQHVVIRKLEPGATYTVSVRAKNATGLSAEATAQITLTTEEAQ